jgi:hypothetical protein
MHAALYRELINVTNEIKDLEPVLLRPDTQVLTAKPSDRYPRENRAGRCPLRDRVQSKQRSLARALRPAIPRAIGNRPPRNAND